jgi:hypothetical protein
LYVSGGGDEVPGKEYLVKIPGVWSMDRKSFFVQWQRMKLILVEPEINIDIYRPEISNLTVSQAMKYGKVVTNETTGLQHTRAARVDR